MYMIPYTNRSSSSLMDLFDEFERSVFGENGRRAPAFSTDIRDEGDHYLLEAELPGFQKEDIDLDVKDGFLTISASHQESSETQKGDWRPLVFILTDGSPTDTDAFNRAVQRIKGAKIANIIACAAGSNANTTYLKQITENVLMMNTLSAGDMAQFFQWVSGSIKMSSQSLDAKPGRTIQLPPPPQGFIVVP